MHYAILNLIVIFGMISAIWRSKALSPSRPVWFRLQNILIGAILVLLGFWSIRYAAGFALAPHDFILSITKKGGPIPPAVGVAIPLAAAASQIIGVFAGFGMLKIRPYGYKWGAWVSVASFCTGLLRFFQMACSSQDPVPVLIVASIIEAMYYFWIFRFCTSRKTWEIVGRLPGPETRPMAAA